MADYSKGFEEQRQAQVANPFQPSGLGQVAADWDPVEAANSPFGPDTYNEASQAWFGGRNTAGDDPFTEQNEGTTNGWDTAFFSEMVNQRNLYLDKAAQADDSREFFNWLNPAVNKEATGVATWNDPTRGLRAGDVYEKGQFKHNVYDIYDKPTADLLLSAIMFDGPEQARINEAGGYGDGGSEARAQKVQKFIDETTEWAAGAESAAEFKSRVDAKKAEYSSGEGAFNESGLGSFAAGAGAGAITAGGIGAAAGSIVPGVGTAIGAGVGAVAGALAGGFTAWMNRDQITEVAARASVKAEMQGVTNGYDAGVLAGLQGVGETAMVAGQGFQNLTQGWFDAEAGTQGDGVSEFYAIDPETGRTKPSAKWEALNVTAALGDSIGQFLSPAGRALYMGTMGTATVGKAGGLVTSDAVFNEETGEWDTLDKPSEYLGAYGSVAIDAVQMGTVGAFAGRTKSIQQAAGVTPRTDADVVRGMWRALPGGKSLANATDSEVVSGLRVFKDASGTVVAARPSIQLAAPSEAIRYVAVGQRARRLALKASDAGRVGADDFYRAHLDMAYNATKFQNALLTGFAEGAEEMAQALLDPMAYSGDYDGFAVARAGAYGFASGAGMALGSQMHLGKAGMRGQSDQMAIMRQRARENVELANAMQFSSQEEWAAYSDGFSDEMILALATRRKDEVTEIGQLIQMGRDLQAYEEGMQNPLGLYAVDDITTTAEGSGNVPNGYAQLKLAPLIQERLFDADGTLLDIKGSVTDTQMSWPQIARRFALKAEMFGAHEADIQATLVTAQQARAAAETAGDQGLVAEADALIASSQADLADAQELNETLQIIAQQMGGLWDQFVAETDENVRRQMIDTLNIGLRDAADNGRWVLPDGGLLQVSNPEIIQRAAEMVFGRQPLMGEGSMVRLVPQISYDLTRTNGHGTMQLHQTVLKILNADFDGDDGVDLNGTYLPKATREALRRGAQFLIKDKKGTGDPAAPHSVVMDEPDQEAKVLNKVRIWSQGRGVPMEFVDDEIEVFGTWLLDRYDGILDAKVLNDALVTFYQEVTAGNADARMNLLNALVTADRTAVLQTGQDNGVQEIPFLSGQITLAFMKIQRKHELYDYTLRRNAGVTDPATVRAATTTAVNSILEDTATLGGDLSLILGADAQRASQKVHYLSWLRAAVGFGGATAEETAGVQPDKVVELARLYMLLGSNEVDTQQEKIDRRDVVLSRVRGWLLDSVRELGREVGKTYTPSEEGALMLAIAQAATPDYDFQADGSTYGNNGRVTIAQMMLRRSVQIERLRYEQQQGDSDTESQLRALERLTRPQTEHSYSADAALLEVFDGEQIGALLGDLHASMGPNLTVGQLQQELIGLASHQRSQKIHLMKNGIGYFKHRGMGDPPYTLDGPDGITTMMTDGRLNGYTILVDALQATADTHIKAMRGRNNTIQEKVERGFKALALRIDQWQAQHRARLTAQFPQNATEQQKRRVILLDLMKNDPDLPKTLQALFTEDSRIATFAINQETGEVVVKAWVMDALTETDTARAVVKYYVGSHLDQYQQLGAQVEHDNREKAATVDASETVAGVPYARIRSRFLQNLHTAARYAAIDGGFTLNQLQQAMYSAKTMDELFAVFNDNPLVMNGREDLVPWYDDVADFETTPNEIFNSAMPGAVQRERFEKMVNRLEHMTTEARQIEEIQTKSRITINAMVKRFAQLGGDDSALLNLRTATEEASNVDELLLLLKLAIEHRRKMPPSKGVNIYDQAIEAAQQAFLLMHDKAKADDRLRNLGAVVFANTSMGAYGGPHAELNNITTLDYDDVASNLSMLSEGPVRIMYADGTYTPVVDLSTVAGVLDALKNPETEMLARAVVLPTSLDINLENALQEYSLNSNAADIADALREERFTNILDLAGDSRVTNAYTLMGLVESAALGQARDTGSTEALAAASHPALHMVNDFVVAYMHSSEAEGKNDKRLRHQLVVDIMDALRRIAMIDDPVLRSNVQRMLRDELQTRVLGGDPVAKMRREQPQLFTLLESLLVDQARESLARRQDELDRKLQGLDPASPEALALLEESTRLNEVDGSSPLRILQVLNPQARFISVETALASFQIDETSEETKAASVERLLNYLGSGATLARLQSKDNAVLVEQVQTLLTQMRTGRLNPEDVTAVDWDKVVQLAATVLVQQAASPTAAWVGLTEIDTTDALQTSYIDPTFSYLVDRLFDPALVDAMRYVIEGAQAGVEKQLDSRALVKYFSDRLFKPENLGTWTTRVPVESVKVRRAVNGTPANRELETKGSIPKTMQAYVNAGMVTFELPDPATAHETVAIDVAAGTNITQFLFDNDPEMLIRLEHHFMASLSLASPDLPAEIPLFDEVGLDTYVSDEVTASGYKVLTMEQLQRAVDRVQRENPGMRRFTVNVEFVDVDKRPPTQQFLNNIYFDGVGREFEGNAGTSPVAAMYFRTMALNNLGQQRPLDFMKSGMAFYTYQTSDFAGVLAMEAGSGTVAELMRRKALHMAGLTYETGRLQMADLPALYKLVKFRHVIRTQDGEFIWPEQAIALESAAIAAGEQLPLFEIIPLSDMVAKTLFQQNSLEGVPGSVRGLPLFNQTDSNGLPSLDKATLKRLGLEQLGTQRDLAQGPATTVGLRSRTYLNEERGAPARGVRPRRIPIQDTGVSAVELGRRQRQTTGDNTPQKMSERNDHYTRGAIELEALLPTVAGMPAERMRQQDLVDDLLSATFASRIQQLKPSSLNITWLLSGDITAQKVSGMATGTLSKVDVDAGFQASENTNAIIYGDVVAIDLVGLRDGLFNGNNDETIRYVTRAVKQLSDRGVSFVLMSKGAPSPMLRAEIADWITTNLPYQGVAGSSYFFEPITELNDMGATSRAEQSSLTETHSITGRNISVWGVNPNDLTMSEGGGFIYEERMRAASRWLNVLIPAQFTTSHPELNPVGLHGAAYSFGLPLGGDLELLKKFLLPLGANTEGRAALRALASGKEGSPDPKGVAIYKRHSDGLVEPGIRSFDDALDILMDRVQTGEFFINQELLPGDFYPFIDSKRNVVLLRYGFEIPGDFIRQFNDNRQQEALYAAANVPTPFTVAVSPPKLVPTQTTNTTTRITEVKRTSRGIEARGTYELQKTGKIVGSYEGLKFGLTFAPRDIKPTLTPLSLQPNNHLTILGEISEKAVVGKGATQQLVNNMRNGFAFFGMDFEDALVDFFAPYYDTSSLTRGEQMDYIQGFLQEWANVQTNMTKAELLALLDMNTMFEGIAAELAPLVETFFPQLTYGSLLNRALPGPGQSENVNERIVSVLLGTLALPGTTYDDVIGSTGLLNLDSLDSDQLVKFMPAVMTQALDDTRFPQTRAYLFDRMRSRLPQGVNGGPDPYQLADDWTFSYITTDADGQKPVYRDVILNFGEYIPAEENPVVQAHTQATKTQQKITPHMINVIDKISSGGRVPYNPDRLQEDGTVIDDFTVEWFTRDYALPYTAAEAESPMRGLLPQVLQMDKTFNNLQQRTYLEQRVIERAEARMRLYSQPVEKTDWDLTEITPLINSILNTLNLNNPSLYSANEAMLDMLVRQYLGAPGLAKDQEGFFDIKSGLYKETLTIIRDNLRGGMNPLHGGQVPLPHARLFLERVFQAQADAEKPWRPAARGGRSGRVEATDWGKWVEAIIGQVKTSRRDFETMFSSDLNGFWQSYTAATPSMIGLPLTPNEMVNAELVSPNKAEGFADLQARWDEVSLNLSLDPAERALMRTPIILESMDRTIETYLGKDQVFNGIDAPNVIAAAMHDKKNQQGAWRAMKKMAKSEKPALADFVAEGRVTIDSHVHGTAFGRSLVNISIINRMLNPAIWVSGFIEVPIMSAFQNVSDLLTGQYMGAGGQTLARMFEDKAISPQYTADEVQALKGLARSLGSNKLWMAELLNELNYQVEIMKNDPRANQRVSIKLEQAATAVARSMSDPRFNTRMTAFARQYLVGVLEYLNSTNSNQISVAQLVALMSRNPLAIKQLMSGEGLNAHQLGLNRLANTRGTKATMPGKAIMAPIHWMVSRESPLMNVPGHILQIPFAFTNFNTGRLVTLTGMSGWDQLIAMFFDARKKPAVLSKIGLGGEQDTWDNLDVLETVDLQKTFIRSGATLTMLMALGLQFGRLGLGGGDDEDRRRARLSKYLNVPEYLDPREPENSFTFADAIYLDQIPFLNNMFKNDAGNSAIVPHWIIQQFSAPIMGMARFFETGDFREIRYGFEAAYAALPNSIDRLIDQADQLATQLVLEAQDEARKASGDPNAAAMTNGWLITAFGVLERALIENSFVNTLYSAFDEYERNPFVLPKTNDEATDGLDRTQGTNLPKRTDARTAVVGPDGKLIEPYLTRTGTDAALHNYAKNNVVAAALLSLFTGQGTDSSYLRQNMAPKEKVIERPELNAEEGKALVYAAFTGAGGQFRLTEPEIVRVLKAQWEATTDERWDQAELEARAKIIFDANNGATALTQVTADGAESFTKYGNKAVINSLYKGSVQLGDPSLRGFALTREQRDVIAEELLTEIKQDAINLGLGTEAANFVMNRIWYGDKETGTIGLQSIIYSQDIPVTNTLRYNQLNVTFALGPDGRPWATPFTRNRVAQAFGIPLANVIQPAGPGTTLDKLGKVVDEVTGINTGLHAIVRQQEPELDPKDLNEILDKVAAKTINPDKDPYVSRKKYGRGYGGGGGGSYARPFFSRMDDLPDGTTPRVEDVPFINSNTPYVRRSRIDRERVFSERGRLNEWQ